MDSLSYRQFVNSLGVVGTAQLSPENANLYWHEHRTNMSEFIKESLRLTHKPEKVAVIGAGECNDLDIQGILNNSGIQKIDFIDLDSKGVESAINRIKKDLITVLGESESNLQLNSCPLDVTFFLEELINDFCKIRWKYARYNFPPSEKEQEKLYTEIISVFEKCINTRTLAEKSQYDVVVSDCILSQLLVSIEIQVQKLLDDIYDINLGARNLYRRLKGDIEKTFIPDHLKILKHMTKPDGHIFIASDQVLLKREKVSEKHREMLMRLKRSGELPENENIRDFDRNYIIEEIPIRRIDYMDGDLQKIFKEHDPSTQIVKNETWEWNRQPHELQKTGKSFSGELVQGLIIRR